MHKEHTKDVKMECCVSVSRHKYLLLLPPPPFPPPPPHLLVPCLGLVEVSVGLQGVKGHSRADGDEQLADLVVDPHPVCLLVLCVTVKHRHTGLCSNPERSLPLSISSALADLCCVNLSRLGGSITVEA